MKIPKREEGQGLVEYALLLALVALVVIVILTILGSSITIAFARVIGGLNGQTLTGSGIESIVTGVDTSGVSGSAFCSGPVEVSFVGFRDGEVYKNAPAVTVDLYVDGNRFSNTGATDDQGFGSTTVNVSGTCPISISYSP